MSRPSRAVRPVAATRRDRAVTVLAAALLTAGTLAALLVGPGAEAGQNPRTATVATGGAGVGYPIGATATRFRGPAFDTCAAPPRKTMAAWRASPYKAVGIYISGLNRACKQPNLTSAWVAEVTAMGWKLLPVNMGLQAPCRDNTRKVAMKATQAGAKGTSEAAAAVAAAQSLGILPGSPIYADIEPYAANKSTCARAVATYLDSWTRELHRLGYLSGMYGNLGAAMPHAVARYASPAHVRPDAIWMARWDRKTSMRGWTGIPDSHWAVHQRVKQYRGDHIETHGKVRINIDSNQIDGPVATVARQYPVTSTSALNARRGPAPTAEIVATREPGSLVAVLCQVTGANVEGSTVWNKLTDGTYVSDAYVAAGSRKPVPPCSYPFQVTAGGGAATRAVPSTTGTAGRALPLGALAWVTCQAGPGDWVRLETGRYLARRDLAAFSGPIPSCA